MGVLCHWLLITILAIPPPMRITDVSGSPRADRLCLAKLLLHHRRGAVPSERRILATKAGPLLLPLPQCSTAAAAAAAAVATVSLACSFCPHRAPVLLLSVLLHRPALHGGLVDAHAASWRRQEMGLMEGKVGTRKGMDGHPELSVEPVFLLPCIYHDPPSTTAAAAAAAPLRLNLHPSGPRDCERAQRCAAACSCWQ